MRARSKSAATSSSLSKAVNHRQVGGAAADRHHRRYYCHLVTVWVDRDAVRAVQQPRIRPWGAERLDVDASRTQLVDAIVAVS